MNSHDLFREVVRFVRGICPGDQCEELQMKLKRGVIVLLPPLVGLTDTEIPAVKEVGKEESAKVPEILPMEFHPIQVAILKTLRGKKKMRGDRLAEVAKIGGKSDLFRRGHGINELRTMGLVKNGRAVGYYLTELGEKVAGELG